MVKTERFGLVLTERERSALREIAAADGVDTQAAVLRRLIRQEARRRGMWPEGGQPQPSQEVRA